jgi:ligand-binding SRPBCC domain-containing protein
MFTFSRIQQFPVASDTVWAFISDPKNLAAITPPDMGFKTHSGDERKMHAGQIIHYSVKPLFGIPVEWVTEITHLEPGKFFVDEQRHGPYKFWHHKHFVREIPGGCEMEDLVHYKLPMGFLGKLVHPLLVEPQLEKIFEFRQKKLAELFGDYKSPTR